MTELFVTVTKVVAFVVLLAAITQIDAALSVKLGLVAGAWLAWA